MPLAPLRVVAAVQHLMRDSGHASNRLGVRRLHTRRGAARLEREGCMSLKSRRLALWMLLLSLIGLAPTAFAFTACTLSTHDCCPARQRSPCENQTPPTTVQRDFTCCAAQPATQQLTINATPSRKMHAPAAPFGSDIGVPAGVPVVTIAFDPPTPPSSVSARFDRTQIYLLTGRLRL